MARAVGRSVLVLAAAALAFGLLAPASSGEPKPPGHNCPNPAGHEPPGQCKKLGTTTTTMGTSTTTSSSTSTTSSSTSTTSSSTTSTTMALRADLSIQKSFVSTTATPFSSGIATYQVIVTNFGPSAAANVVVFDQASTPITGSSGAMCGPAGSTSVSCPLGTISPGQLVFHIHVQDPFTAPTFDQVQVTSSTPDPVPGNNADSAGGP